MLFSQLNANVKAPLRYRSTNRFPLSRPGILETECLLITYATRDSPLMTNSKTHSHQRLVLLAVLAVWSAASPLQGQLFGPPPERGLEQGAEAAKQVEQQMGLYS